MSCREADSEASCRGVIDLGAPLRHRQGAGIGKPAHGDDRQATLGGRSATSWAGAIGM